MRGAAQIAAKVLPAILSDVGHGSHLCAFYETKEDLTDLVLPFFDAGRSQGELCVWMMPDVARVILHMLVEKNGVTRQRALEGCTSSRCVDGYIATAAFLGTSSITHGFIRGASKRKNNASQ